MSSLTLESKKTYQNELIWSTFFDNLGIVFGFSSGNTSNRCSHANCSFAMGVTIWLSNVTDVTQYALNIITLIGIGIGRLFTFHG